MKLLNVRSIFTANSTIGKLFVDGVFLCYILEPFDRGLTSAMNAEQIAAIKVPGKTAIADGVYPLSLISGEPIINRFPWIRKYYSVGSFFVPELQNVTGFEAILLHPGNYPKDTEGCSLVGMSIAGADFIGDTPDAFVKLQQVCFDAIKAGGVTYEIQRDVNVWKAFQDANS